MGSDGSELEDGNIGVCPMCAGIVRQTSATVLTVNAEAMHIVRIAVADH